MSLLVRFLRLARGMGLRGPIRTWIGRGAGCWSSGVSGLVQHIGQHAIDGMQRQHIVAALIEVMPEG